MDGRFSERWSPRSIFAWQLTVAVCSICVHLAVAQENAAMTIPSSLLDCYSNGSLLSRQGLPRFGITQLIDIIRKVENYPITSLDLRNMAVQLTHRFRQDGIRRDPRIVATDGVIPYTPSGPEFFRHQILLMKLIPGNAYNFPNNSLSMAEQCALHFMMSSTIDDVVRNDEDTTCSNLKNYETDVYGSSSGGSYNSQSSYGGGGYSSGVNWGRRAPAGYPTRGPRRTRQAREAKPPGIDSDVEILDPSLRDEVAKTRASMSNYVHSRCPQQSGVVFTPWGAVMAGTVIAGIAAGLVPQTVPAETLANAFPRSRHYTQRNGRNPGLSADTMGLIDNKWAATFSGDLAQVALLQGPTLNNNMMVGVPGGWNSTVEPSHYFISPDSRLQTQTDGTMSDANIRGCIDGLIMGTYVNDWYSKSGSYLKLSQLLDMYYSERGVFDRSTRACLRRERFGDVATSQTLDSQTETFSKFYGNQNPLTVTMTNDIITQFSDLAVTKLQSYIPSSLNDPPCTVATTDLMIRPYVDLIVVLDISWQYEYIHPAIAFLLDKVDAGLYGSKVMILSGKDGSMLFNSTYPRLDWQTSYTRQIHDNARVGSGNNFDMTVSLGAVMQQLRQHDNMYSDRHILGGRGQAVLYVTMNGLGSYDQMSLYNRLINFRRLYPDVDQLVLTQGNKNAFAAITNDTNTDVFTLAPSDPANSILPLISRLKTIPRRVRNPNCNADWVETRTGNSEFVDYVEPMGVNYYRISPNNFFQAIDEYAKVRVTTQSYGSLTVCYSRSMPAMNGTKNTFASQSADAGTCQQMGNSGMDISVYNLCSDSYYVSDCKPMYIAVSAPQPQSSSTSIRCTEDACRFPDMLKYTISVERVGCWSGASGLHAVGLTGTLLLAVALRLLQQ